MTIQLRCPECGRTKLVPRTPCDPPEAVRVVVICPNCDDGDCFDVVPYAYFDSSGKDITRDSDRAAMQSGKVDDAPVVQAPRKDGTG